MSTVHAYRVGVGWGVDISLLGGGWESNSPLVLILFLIFIFVRSKQFFNVLILNWYRTCQCSLKTPFWGQQTGM